MIDRLPPSRAHRWSRCAASIAFENAYPEQAPTDEAREGTAAAWVAECVLKGDAFECADLVGRHHKNGWLITPDMAAHVQGYVDMIKARGGSIVVEHQTTLTPMIYGTLDCAATVGGSSIFIDDLKYGFKIVEPDSPQLWIYAAAEMFRMWREGHQITHAHIGIYQPRAFHPDGVYRTVTATAQELTDFAAWIVDRGNAALAPNPSATPGRQCENCAAAAHCAALAASSYEAFTIISSQRHRQMTAKEAANDWLFLELAHDLIKARRKAVEAEITARYKSEHFPGVEMVASYGHRKFNFDAATVSAFTGIDAADIVVASPAEMERRGADPKVVNAMSSAPYIGHRLKKISQRQIAKAFK